MLALLTSASLSLCCSKSSTSDLESTCNSDQPRWESYEHRSSPSPVVLPEIDRTNTKRLPALCESALSL